MEIVYNPNSTHGESLEHSGIKDMHWGIRRWQNPDGSLTPAGKIRYGRAAASARKNIAKQIKKDAKILDNLDRKSKTEQELQELAIKQREAYKLEVMKDPRTLYKNRDLFTNEELKSAMARIETEQKLKNMADVKMGQYKRTADIIIGYGKTINDAYKTINELVGNVKPQPKGDQDNDQEKKKQQ